MVTKVMRPISDETCRCIAATPNFKTLEIEEVLHGHLKSSQAIESKRHFKSEMYSAV